MKVWLKRWIHPDNIIAILIGIAVICAATFPNETKSILQQVPNVFVRGVGCGAFLLGGWFIFRTIKKINKIFTYVETTTTASKVITVPKIGKNSDEEIIQWFQQQEFDPVVRLTLAAAYKQPDGAICHYGWQGQSQQQFADLSSGGWITPHSGQTRDGNNHADKLSVGARKILKTWPELLVISKDSLESMRTNADDWNIWIFFEILEQYGSQPIREFVHELKVEVQNKVLGPLHGSRASNGEFMFFSGQELRLAFTQIPHRYWDRFNTIMETWVKS